MSKQLKVIKFRGVELVQSDDGWHLWDVVEPVDPTEDLETTTKMILWIIQVILWIVGKVRSRKVREEMAAGLLREYQLTGAGA